MSGKDCGVDRRIPVPKGLNAALSRADKPLALDSDNDALPHWLFRMTAHNNQVNLPRGFVRSRLWLEDRLVVARSDLISAVRTHNEDLRRLPPR